MQAVVGARFGEVLLREPSDDGAFRLLHRLAVELAGVDERAVANERFVERRIGRFVRGENHAHDGQVELGCELEVAAVVAWHGHDGAGAVAHQHVVRDPDGNPLAVHWIDAVAAGEDACFFLLHLLAFHQILFRDGASVRIHGGALGIVHDRIDQRMFRRQNHVGGAEQGVRAGGENADRFRRTGHRENHFRAFAAPDPIRLRLLRRRRPVDVGQIGKQPRRVVGDAEEPLRQFALFHGGFAAFAGAGDHLLVGKHRLARRAPVHRSAATFHQAAFQQLQEDPLRPLVVGGAGGIHGVVPVVHAAETLQHADEVGDVGGNQVVRIPAHLQRVVLRMDAEGVEADGLEHVLALQAPVAAVHVGAGIGVEVADVQPFRGRIGEHHQVVVGRFGVAEIVFGEGVGASPIPLRLPLRLDRLRVVALARHGTKTMCNGERCASVPPGALPPARLAPSTALVAIVERSVALHERLDREPHGERRADDIPRDKKDSEHVHDERSKAWRTTWSAVRPCAAGTWTQPRNGGRTTMISPAATRLATATASMAPS